MLTTEEAKQIEVLDDPTEGLNAVIIARMFNRKYPYARLFINATGLSKDNRTLTCIISVRGHYYDIRSIQNVSVFSNYFKIRGEVNKPAKIQEILQAADILLEETVDKLYKTQTRFQTVDFPPEAA